jgi:hypothetical protein
MATEVLGPIASNVAGARDTEVTLVAFLAPEAAAALGRSRPRRAEPPRHAASENDFLGPESPVSRCQVIVFERN